ncbi:glucokinase [Thalassotalea euphylliae]|uniref:Glucokinase n=1 Tax=Thalassotalea euphylliae TaxID=1655234 RepID=A0A3E0UIQ3_9GAMM|nr:glucokinase [Thalassotalea euphylliae]REL35632.1 glucokinase [Thalassotalea euphylliae]
MLENVVNIVADIGGTNLRIGIAQQDGSCEALTVYQCAKYASLVEVIADFIEKEQLSGKTINACFAIACPVENDLVVMTNLPWQFSKTQLKSALGLNKLLLINDFTAIAHAIPMLSDEQKVQIGGGESVAGKPISVCGPGTGLGVANLIQEQDAQQQETWLSLSGEGGHVDFAPVDKQEIDILEFLLTKYQHVSYEQLLSGLGIEQIYQALASKNSSVETELAAQDITTRALASECEVCAQALAQFCKTLGSFAGNLALTLGSFGGVYIAGGIVPRFIEYFKSSDFRQRFEEKGRMSGFNQNIPTYVITESQPGILGATAYLLQDNLQHDLQDDIQDKKEAL